MAEFNDLDIKIVDKGEQIVFDNKTNNALSVGMGIVFDKDGEYHVTVHNNRITVMINALPSAQPKRGKWILNRSGAYCCSECMEPCASYVMMKPRDRFCKMCGAKMEVTT